MKNTKMPAIRFKGFNDDWEQRKVGDYLTESREIGNKGDVAHKMTVKLWGKGVYEKLEVGSTNTQYFIRHANQFIYSKLDFLNCAFGVVPEELESLETTADVPAFDCVDMNPYFMFYRAIQPSFYIQNGIIANGSRKAKRIHADTFLEMPISVPELTEQNKIVEYFQSLDDLITLHQRKLEKIELLKKSMLEKMFTRDTENIPKIRFDRYTDDWEQRKLSDCAGFRRGSFPQPYGNKDWYDGEGAMPFVQVADVSDDMKLVDDTKQKISKLAQPISVCAEEGSVLVTLQGSIGRVAITQYKAFVDRTVLIFDKYNANIDKTFWAYIIKEKFIEEARKAPGGTIKTITKEVLSNFDLMLPSYDEQKRLGKLLHSLDDLITLHQRKLEKLKKVKKSLLEHMFSMEK